MTRRIIVGLIVAAIGLGCVANAWAFDVLVLGIGLGCLYELNALCEIKGQPLEYPVAIAGVVGYVVLCGHRLGAQVGRRAAGRDRRSPRFWIGMYGEQKGYFARTAYTLLAVLYIGKLLTYFVFIRAIPGNGMWMTCVRRSF